MYTSCFGRVKTWVKPPLEAVAISRGLPRFTKKMRREIRLAPTWEMMEPSVTHVEFIAAYNADILAKLDPAEVFKSIGENGVMLCWERPNVKCHRRIVAEWLEAALGIEVTELGLTREEVIDYVYAPGK